MAVAFDKEETKKYESWFLTPAGVYVDGKEKEIILQNVRFKRGEKVLEIGAGTGRYIEYLSELGLDVTGVEPMEDLYKMALQKTGIKEGQVIKAPFENLPFADKSFDNAVSIIGFQFSGDKEKAMKEMFRVARNKTAIGFLNRYSISNVFNTKQRRRLYREAEPLSGKELEKMAERALGETVKNYDIRTKYTLYLPVNIGHFVPFFDDFMEKINLPFGNFGIMIVTKKQR